VGIDPVLGGVCYGHHRYDIAPPPGLVVSLRQALNHIEIRQAQTAHLLCRLIPGRCPFARTFRLGTYQVSIPPLCQLNPLYEELMALRMRALDYLTTHGVDITPYLEAPDVPSTCEPTADRTRL
jgi:hypothetical protein